MAMWCHCVVSVIAIANETLRVLYAAELLKWGNIKAWYFMFIYDEYIIWDAHIKVQTINYSSCTHVHGMITLWPWFTHDCTFKESLFSTHPYLIFLNKKSFLPVMTRRSMLGYCKNISILWVNQRILWQRAGQTIHSSLTPRYAFWTGPPKQ